jgi:disulfide bond formation protein DsbB
VQRLARTPEPAAASTLVSTRTLAVYASWIVAIVATLGSLYYSEVMRFVPCVLCWWQRVLMYPLVIVLGVATLRQDTGVWRTALPFSVIGLGVSTYHYLLQKVPGMAPPASCAVGVPCTAVYVNYFGFVTIPLMAGTAFALITLALAYVALRGRERRS